MFNFYLGLYMKARGNTDQQRQDLIAIGFVAERFYPYLAVAITDYFGRRKPL